jgi:hypothetical protein
MTNVLSKQKNVLEGHFQQTNDSNSKYVAETKRTLRQILCNRSKLSLHTDM